MLKKVGYIFLAFLLFLQAGGLLLHYQGLQMKAGLQMKDNIAKGHFTTMKMLMPVAKYDSCRVGASEVRVGENLYDVTAVTVCGDKIELTVIADVEETKQGRKIAKVLGCSGSASDVPTSLLILLSFVYLLPEPFILPKAHDSKSICHTIYYAPLASRFLHVSAPPPWQLSC